MHSAADFRLMGNGEESAHAHAHWCVGLLRFGNAFVCLSVRLKGSHGGERWK